MYPVLFSFLEFNVYSYGFCIMVGALMAYYYALREGRKINIDSEKLNEMALCIFAASYVGGKVFLWFSDWDYFMENPGQMIVLNGNGFVFYGSLLFSLGILLWFFKRNRINPGAMFDILAVGATLIHGFGKIGCFMAGCCYGKACDKSLGVIYNNPLSQAEPLETPLYPVQLIDAAILLSCTFLLLYLKPRKQFNGQLMLVYLFVYAVGRFFTEFLRGDDDRGFIFNGSLSQSQFVSILLVGAVSVIYFFLLKKSKLVLEASNSDRS